MDWLVKNAKILVGLLIVSLLANVGMILWVAKTEKKLVAIESAYATPQPVNTNIHSQNQAEKKAEAAEGKFYRAPQLQLGKGKGY